MNLKCNTIKHLAIGTVSVVHKTDQPPEKLGSIYFPIFRLSISIYDAKKVRGRK